MEKELLVLCATAASIGLIHTVLGPDHYLPFIVMGRARNWSLLKTNLITFACGVGHVLSSIVIGLIGIFLGVQLMKLEALEAFRGNIAAWALIGFGLAYFIWGIRKAITNKPHEHLHVHDGALHAHEHVHSKDHAHVHTEKAKSITPWILFTIFVLGPCEPLIPILMYPAAKNSLAGVVLVSTVFGGMTVGAMLLVVTFSSLGARLIPLGRLERYTHALAGATICVSGLAIQFLGL